MKLKKLWNIQPITFEKVNLSESENSFVLTFDLCLSLTVSSYWEEFLYHLGIVRYVKTKYMQQFLVPKRQLYYLFFFMVQGQTWCCTCVHRFSLVDPGNIVRLLAPDLAILFSSLFVLRLCNKLTHPAPQVNLHENGIPLTVVEVNAHYSFILNVQSYHPDCSSGLSGGRNIWNRVWGWKWHGRILL